MSTKISSTVKLNVPSKPPVQVKRHYRAKSINLFKGHDGKSSILTNDLLRKGGALPYIVPEEEKDDNSSSNSRHSNVSQARKLRPSKKRMFSDEKKIIDKTLHLEQQVEQLSCKLSTVQMLLENQKLSEEDGKSDKQSPRENTDLLPNSSADAFSVSDYIEFLAEMNESIPVDHYDPAEFSEHATTTTRYQNDHEDETHLPSNVNWQSSAEERNTLLHSIHDELLEWRKSRDISGELDYVEIGSDSSLSTHYDAETCV